MKQNKIKYLSYKIKNVVKKFKLNLNNKIVLTEAASGNYVVTAQIAALAGAKVYAFTQDSKFASIEEVESQTMKLAKELNLLNKISVINNLTTLNLSKIDILTNTGFLRPINREIIERLRSDCVIPLMWEPWEYRKSDIDLELCLKKGIKVYGTNEEDKKLRTKEYIGYIVLKIFMNNGILPFNSDILVMGSRSFSIYLETVLKNNLYKYRIVNKYNKKIETQKYNTFVFLEHENERLLLSDNSNAFINAKNLNENDLILHICGNIEHTNITQNMIPEKPSKFGYMSFTTDYVTENAVIDLHAAGLKVAEGMIKANQLKLKQHDYKIFLEKNYPALAFKEEKYW